MEFSHGLLKFNEKLKLGGRKSNMVIWKSTSFSSSFVYLQK